MLLQDFAAQRGVKANTVAAYMLAHATEFEGHTTMDGKQKVLDEVALELLDAKYPLPRPVQIIQDTEAREQLAVALRELADARGRIGEIYGQLLDAQQRAHVAELAAARVEQLQAAVDDQQVKIEQAAAELQQAQEAALQAQAGQRAAELQVEQLREELQAERSKSWIQRILGR